MRNLKSFKRTAFTLVLAIMLCVSATVGGTIAWFTDSVTSNLNYVEAGKLDIELKINDVRVTEDSEDDLFVKPELWEPGAVAYANLDIINAGNLALKYQMKLNVSNENNLNGHQLSEVLKLAVVDKIATDATRAAVLAKAEAEGNTVFTLGSFEMNGDLLKGETDTCALVVYWPTTNTNDVDNQYNANNGQTTSDGKPLHIDFGVALEATQLTAEQDAFDNQYDANADFSGSTWNGSADAEDAPTEPEADGYIHIATAEEFAAFAAAVNAGNTYAGKTVVLDADINLNNNAWTPIGNANQKTFNGTFDGNGKTIYNLSVVGNFERYGLFGDLQGNVQNLNIVNANISPVGDNDAERVGVVAGYAYRKISNVNVSNATVNGNHFVGGIVGYSHKDVTNCTVKNAVITAEPNAIDNGYDNGDKAGGIVGYVIADGSAAASASVTGCTVEDVQITAYRDVGGIAGFAQESGGNTTISGNTVKDTTIVVDQITKYYGDEDNNAGEIVGRRQGEITETDNTATNVTVTAPTVIRDAAGLRNIANGGYFVLANDIDLSAIDDWSINDTGELQDDLVLDGNGHSIKNMKTNGQIAGLVADPEGNKLTIKNLTIANSTISGNNENTDGEAGIGAFVGWIDHETVVLENCIVENCTIKGSKYIGGLIGYAGSALTVNNCTVKDSDLISDYSEDEGETYKGHMGGLLGLLNNGQVSNCSVNNNTFTVATPNKGRAGLFVGTNYSEGWSNNTASGNTGITVNQGSASTKVIG